MQSDLEQLYDNNIERLYKFFFYKTLSKELAQDLTSETFLAVASSISSGQKIDNLTAYLYGVARNVFVRFLTSKYKLAVSSLPEGDFYNYAEEFVEHTERGETLEDKLLALVDKIPEKQAIVLRLRLIDKLTIKEIAARLGHNVNYVKTTQRRAIKSTKLLLENYPLTMAK